MSTLIFIDTNIFLDFYRVRGRDTNLSLLIYLNSNHDRIITTSQVEMEYKKNRPGTILKSLKSFKTPDWGNLQIPAFLAEAQPSRMIVKHKEKILKQSKKVKQKFERVLANPSQNDPVYRALQRLFKSKEKYHLTWNNKDRQTIMDLAKKRFDLGYPPRKQKDTSYGDAINWEWIVQCAKKSADDIVIVSRDSDYGITYGDKQILNDWLLQEFKDRVSRQRSIILTDRLADGFKRADIRVTKEEEDQEKLLIIQLKESEKEERTHKIKEVEDAFMYILTELNKEMEALLCSKNS